MLQLGKSLANIQLVGHPLRALATVEEVLPVVCVQQERGGAPIATTTQYLHHSKVTLFIIRYVPTCQYTLLGCTRNLIVLFSILIFMISCRVASSLGMLARSSRNLEFDMIRSARAHSW